MSDTLGLRCDRTGGCVCDPFRRSPDCRWSAKTKYEHREITRTLETDAETFAVRFETRNGSTYCATRWLSLTREQVAQVAELFR